jgi:hypothetical protein
MIRFGPSQAIQPLKEHPGGRMPGPPEIVSQFAQAIEALGQVRKGVGEIGHGAFLIGERLDDLDSFKNKASLGKRKAVVS